MNYLKIAIPALLLVLAASPVLAADATADPMIAELKGETEAQKRSPQELEAAYAKAIELLAPDVANEDPAKRYAAMKAIDTIAIRTGRAGAEAERLACCKAMGAALGPKTSVLARVWLIRQIQLVGKAECVPVLVSLLDDKEEVIRESARRALQYLRVPEATAALAAALEKATTPEWRVAMLNALADRRDASTVPAFVKAIADKNEAVVLAGLAGLGKIRGAEAAKALAAAKATVPATLKARRIDACLQCAEQMLKDGQKDAAAAIYTEIYVPTESEAIRMAALRGIIASKGEKAMPLVAEILGGQDEKLKGMALSFVAEVPGPEATKSMISLLPKLPPAGQAALLGELGRRGELAKPAVLEAAKSKDDAVRTAALKALGDVGTGAEVPLLAQAAATGQGPEADAARNSLAALNAKDANSAMLAELGKGDAKVKTELVRALAARKAVEAAPALIKAAADADPALKSEAIKGLDAVGDEKALPVLIGVVGKTQNAEDAQAAEKAILSISARTTNKDACLQPLLGSLAGAQMPTRGVLLRALGKVGGEKALTAVRAALKDADAKVKEAAIRSLADWPDDASGTDLLAVAKTDEKQTNQVLALRGYIRLAGVPADKPAAAKFKMCQEALAVCKRPDEKKLVLGVLADVNTPEAFKLVVPMLSEDPLKNEAAVAATKIAKSLGNNLPEETKEAMDKVLTITKDRRVQKDAEDVIKKIKPKK